MRGTAVIALVIISCACSPAAGFDPETGVRFIDPEGRFEITYPNTWMPNHLAEDAAFSIRNRDNTKFGVLSIHIKTYDTNNKEIEEFFENDRGRSVLEGAKSRFGEVRFVEAKETKLGGEIAHLTRIDYRLQNLDVDMWIANVQLIALHDGAIYLVNFESPTDTFEENYLTFRASLYTFAFRYLRS